MVWLETAPSGPWPSVRTHLRMLRCGPSNRTFVHLAAFLLAETPVLQDVPDLWFDELNA
jgi:hypothetical protein